MVKTPKQSEPQYQELSAQLNEVLAALQKEDVDVDAALVYYRQGLELVQRLKTYLNTAENTVVQLQTKYTSDS
jgi:exodeoxyribonuclease VII small subunit